MKVLFFISSLRAGGAERVASILCNYWSDNGNDIYLLTFDTPQNDFYVINNEIKRYFTGIYCSGKSCIIKRIYLNLIRLLRTRKIITATKPDVVVSFMDAQNIIALLACLFTGIPVVVSERTYPQYYNDGNLFDCVRKRIYKLSNAFVSQTNDVKVWAQKFIGATKIKVIPNPIDGSKMSKQNLSSCACIRQNHILAIGRLDKQKGFDLLVKAYDKCRKSHPEWRLFIVGDGEERKNLEEQIAASELDKYVFLVGRVNNPEMYYKSSRIFVLSSRVEGFPNVLLEAMAYGLPVVSFDCKAGPSDIIKHGENGLLVSDGDIDALSNAMKKLMDNEILREMLSHEALKVCDKYDIEFVSKQWFNLLKEVINERKK